MWKRCAPRLRLYLSIRYCFAGRQARPTAQVKCWIVWLLRMIAFISRENGIGSAHQGIAWAYEKGYEL